MSCLYVFKCPHGKTLNFLHQCELCAKDHLAERAETIRQQQAEIDRLTEYEQAIHAHFDVAFHSYDSAKSVYDNLTMLQSWHCAVALDPKVSKDAAELHDRIDRLTEQRDRLLNQLTESQRELIEWDDSLRISAELLGDSKPTRLPIQKIINMNKALIAEIEAGK